MADEQGSRSIRFGIPQEEQDFLGRNSRFMEGLPKLEARLSWTRIASGLRLTDSTRSRSHTTGANYETNPIQDSSDVFVTVRL